MCPDVTTDKDGGPPIGHLRSQPHFKDLAFPSEPDSISVMTLGTLNTSWARFLDLYAETGKPVGDLGACYSTLSAEAALRTALPAERNIEIVPVDFMVPHREEDYETEVLARMKLVEPMLIKRDDEFTAEDA